MGFRGLGLLFLDGCGAYLVVNTYVGHIVVPGCNDTGNSCIHINHHCHGYEEGAHGREDDVALVLVVPALPQVPSSRLVPGREMEMSRIHLMGHGDYFYVW